MVPIQPFPLPFALANFHLLVGEGMWAGARRSPAAARYQRPFSSCLPAGSCQDAIPVCLVDCHFFFFFCKKHPCGSVPYWDECGVGLLAPP